MANSCSPQVINGQIYTNIRDLPTTDEVIPGDKLIVETENGTSIIDFEDFIIDKSNISFSAQIDASSSDILTLSAKQTTQGNTIVAQNDVLNRFVTFKTLYETDVNGFSFNSTGIQLPVNMIQSNSIDYNLSAVSSTKTSLVSNIMTLNPGSYQVSITCTISGGPAFVELYNSTTADVLLQSDYSSYPTINGMIVLATRSDLYLRGYASGERNLGYIVPFSNKKQAALVATFQFLTGGLYNLRF